jgi:hypothetical protein
LEVLKREFIPEIPEVKPEFGKRRNFIIFDFMQKWMNS